MIGLAYYLLKAGVPCVVASLWKVADESTRHLMERFYANLVKGDTVAAALREAKTWLRTSYRGNGLTDYSNPYYWAPFIVIGDGDVRIG